MMLEDQYWPYDLSERNRVRVSAHYRAAHRAAYVRTHAKRAREERIARADARIPGRVRCALDYVPSPDGRPMVVSAHTGSI